MKVEYVFSRNKKIGSRLISWAAGYEKLGLDKNPSHIGVLLNNEWVVESTFFTGVRVVPYYKWKEINEELYKIPCEHEYRESQGIMDKATNLWGKGYDWIGVLFFTWAYIKLILFNEKLPEDNRWHDKNRYFCTEYVGKLTDQNLSMKSPAKVCADWLIK